MNLPQSIESLTESRQGDLFATRSVDRQSDVTVVYDIIRQKLNFTATKAFDEGVAFYKISNDEKAFLKNIIELYIELITKNLKQTTIDDNVKDNVIVLFKNNMTSIIQLIENLFTYIYSVIPDKKVIDINQISCNILGYAIETFRKNNNFKPD